jgi:hypothetical protein
MLLSDLLSYINAGPVVNFSSVAAASAFTFGRPLPGSITTAGFAAPGDGGGAMYIPAAGPNTGGFQSADGQWWKLAIPNFQRRAAMASRLPVIWDDFDVVDGTLLNGKLTPTGQTWVVTGPGAATAVIKNGAWQNTANSYAYLPYGQNIIRIAGSLSYIPISGTGNDRNAGWTLIADGFTGGGILNTMLHFTFSPFGGTLSKRINGGAFVGIGSFSHYLVPGSVYSVAMEINNSAHTVTVYAPDGGIYTITDADIGTNIIATYGVWQLTGTPTITQGQWHSAELGPSDAKIFAGSGRSSPALGVDALWGYGFNTNQQQVGAVTDIAGTANIKGSVNLSGGIGWYTLLTQSSEGSSSFILSGRMRLSVYDGAAWGGWEFDVDSNTSGTILTNLRVARNIGNIIDQIRVSAGVNTIQLDVHVASANNPVTLKCRFIGVGALSDAPIVGAVPLVGGILSILSPVNPVISPSNVSTIVSKQFPPGGTSNVPGQIQLTGGIGWYRIITQVAWGDFNILGKLRFEADDNIAAGVKTFADMDINTRSFDKGVYIRTSGQSISGSCIDQIRYGGNNPLFIDVHVNTANAVTLTYEFTGLGTIVLQPVVGAAAGVNFNNVFTITSASQPVVVDAVAFNKAPPNPGQGTLCGFTDSTANTFGAIIAGGGTNKVLGHFNGTNWTVAGI